MIMNSDSDWREQGCMPMKTHQSVSLRFEETHDQKPPPRERRLQLRIAGFVMRVVAFVELRGSCEFYWKAPLPKWSSSSRPSSARSLRSWVAEFCFFSSDEWKKVQRAALWFSGLRPSPHKLKRRSGAISTLVGIAPPLLFCLQWYIWNLLESPAASLRPAIPGIPASCRPASRRKWLWFGLDIGFSLRIGLVCHALVCSFFSAT